MDGYNSVIRMVKEKPNYVPLIRKCVEAHEREDEKQQTLGFEWNDVGVWPVRLALLATEYDLLKITYKSNRATCYMIKDIDGVKKALQDIDAAKVGAPDVPGMTLRVWLSVATMQRLRSYVSREFPDKWDAESLAVERALNLLLETTEPAPDHRD